MLFKYGLGSTARDKITGYEGLIIARTEWLYGCHRYILQAQKLDDKGNPIAPHHVDQDAIELITAADIPVKSTGGDAPMPERGGILVRSAASPVR